MEVLYGKSTVLDSTTAKSMKLSKKPGKIEKKEQKKFIKNPTKARWRRIPRRKKQLEFLGMGL
jgi:hypothetical protein